MWSALLGESGGPSFHELMSEGRSSVLRPVWEMVKCLFGKSQYTFPGLGLALVELLPRKLTPAHTARMARAAEAFKARLEELLVRVLWVMGTTVLWVCCGWWVWLFCGWWVQLWVVGTAVLWACCRWCTCTFLCLWCGSVPVAVV